MKTVSLLEFRQKAMSVLSYVQKGQGVVLTYRGKPVARLEPLAKRAASGEDPFYTLDRLADARVESATNQDMDRVIYGS